MEGWLDRGRVFARQERPVRYGREFGHFGCRPPDWPSAAGRARSEAAFAGTTTITKTQRQNKKHPERKEMLLLFVFLSQPWGRECWLEEEEEGEANARLPVNKPNNASWDNAPVPIGLLKETMCSKLS